VAVIVAAVPAHTVDELTDTVGKGLTLTVPLADAETQPVVVLVITTLYVPATVEVKIVTLPGLVTPAGTVQT
jgi:hypothetical protein